MAAPPNKTIKDLNGQWVMNKTLGDNPEPILALQGVGWLTRKAIGAATVTLTIKQYKDDAGVEHIDITGVLTGGLTADPEPRTLNNEWGEQDNKIFGKVKGWTKWTKKDEIEDEHLKNGWLDESDGELVCAYAESINNGWTSTQIWGFEEINGERRYTRHVVVKKADTTLKIRQVYDWKSE